MVVLYLLYGSSVGILSSLETNSPILSKKFTSELTLGVEKATAVVSNALIVRSEVSE